MKKILLTVAMIVFSVNMTLFAAQAQKIIDPAPGLPVTPRGIGALPADPCRILRNDGAVVGDDEEVITGCVTNVEFGRVPNSCIVMFGEQQFLVPENYNGICQLAIASATLKKRVISYTRPANVEGNPNADATDIIFMKLDL